MSTPLSDIELGKQAAAVAAVSDWLSPSLSVIGVGSGSTIEYAVEAMAARAENSGTRYRCVCTSFQSRALVARHRPFLSLADLDECPVIDVNFDGADECDRDLNLIKGGGACMTQEKLVASASKCFIVIADARKDSKFLGQQWKKGVPIEVLPMAHSLVSLRLIELVPNSVPQLRMAMNKAGPVVTDNGMFVIDWKLPENCSALNKDKIEATNQRVSMIPGVLETGLFVQMADVAYFGTAHGSVVRRERPANK